MASKSFLFGRGPRIADEVLGGAYVQGVESVGGDAPDEGSGNAASVGSAANAEEAQKTGAERAGSGQSATAAATAEGEATETKEPTPTYWEKTGGLVGLFISSFPVTVFSFVNAWWGLLAGIGAAIATAVLFVIVRLLLKRSVSPAIGGFVGVLISSSIAYCTGQAKGFFLFGIWFYLACLTFTLVTLVIRRPLAGLLWSSMNRRGVRWRTDKASLHGYDLATVAWALVFASRFVVQHWLYDRNLTGWLAVAKISMGYPLTLAAFAAVIWAVRRSDRRLRLLDAGEEAGERGGTGPAVPEQGSEAGDPEPADPARPADAAAEEDAAGTGGQLKPTIAGKETPHLNSASVPGEAG